MVEKRHLPRVMESSERLEYAFEKVDKWPFIVESVHNSLSVNRVREGKTGLIKLGPETWSTISEDVILKLLLSFGDIKDGNTVFELGTGSGYSTAILSEMVGPTGKVVSIERDPELAEKASDRLYRLGYTNVDVLSGDGTRGYIGSAPYDRMICTASLRSVPLELYEQLDADGRIVLPYGEPLERQALMTLQRVENRLYPAAIYHGVGFVPVITEQQGLGWTPKDLQKEFFR